MHRSLSGTNDALASNISAVEGYERYLSSLDHAIHRPLPTETNSRRTIRSISSKVVSWLVEDLETEMSERRAVAIGIPDASELTDLTEDNVVDFPFDQTGQVLYDHETGSIPGTTRVVHVENVAYLPYERSADSPDAQHSSGLNNQAN